MNVLTACCGAATIRRKPEVDWHCSKCDRVVMRQGVATLEDGTVAGRLEAIMDRLHESLDNPLSNHEAARRRARLEIDALPYDDSLEREMLAVKPPEVQKPSILEQVRERMDAEAARRAADAYRSTTVKADSTAFEKAWADQWEQIAKDVDANKERHRNMPKRVDGDGHVWINGVRVTADCPVEDMMRRPYQSTTAKVEGLGAWLPAKTGHLKHGPGGLGGPGPCDADCAKCHTMAVRELPRSVPVDPMTVEHDGLSLRTCIAIDERLRRYEGAGTEYGLRSSLTPAQRAAVSAHWSAQLRSRIADAADAERRRVTVDLEDDL